MKTRDPDFLLRSFRIDLGMALMGLDAVEQAEREKVVREALTWLGTPYRICADVKGSGVDCGMLLVRVFVDTGICAPFDPRPYPEQWHLHQVAERYMGIVTHFAHEVEPPPQRDLLPGDLILFKYGKVFSHGAIFIGGPKYMFIHCSRPLPCEATYLYSSPGFMRMEKKYFSVWPKIEGSLPPRSFMELGAL